jgi:hypothetical protein
MHERLDDPMRWVDGVLDPIAALHYPVDHVGHDELQRLLVDLFDRNAPTGAVYDPNESAAADVVGARRG